MGRNDTRPCRSRSLVHATRVARAAGNVGGECNTDNGLVNIAGSYHTGSLPNASWMCSYYNFDLIDYTIYAWSMCCRIPGR